MLIAQTFCVAAVYEAIRAICEYSHQLGSTIVFGFATAHTASIEAGQGMHLYSMLSCLPNTHYGLLNSFSKQVIEGIAYITLM